MAKKKAKKVDENIDGLGPKDLKHIQRAVRQVWSWSYPCRLVRKRTLGADGFPVCELCKKTVPKIFVDHKKNVGVVGGPEYIQKMFVASKFLQGLCKKCHDTKTKKERTRDRALKKKLELEKDFF